MQSRESLNAAHPKHDRVLVARYAAGDAYSSETSEAKRLVDGCDECAALASDIRLISARTSELPGIGRPRDFRISAEQADQLRGSLLDQLMRRISAPGWGLVQPLAAAAMVIGLALAVVGALPLGSISTGGLTEAIPATATQRDAAATTAPLKVAQQPVAATGGASDQFAATPAPLPAATSATAPEAGGATASAEPGTVVDSSSGAPGNHSAAPQPQSATVEPAPPTVLRSSAPRATTSNYAYTLPSAAPTTRPISNSGQPIPPQSPQTTFDGSWLVVVGLMIAFLALIALLLVWAAKRRYSDPLVR